MESSPSSTLKLHDCLALGEVEHCLSPEDGPLEEEVQRLPMLLRILSAARPLSSIPSLLPTDHPDEDDNEEEEDTDSLIQAAVDRLEERAAIYSAAEGVEVVACHLAPSLCRRLAKVRPPSMVNGRYQVAELQAAAAQPMLVSRSKRRKLSELPKEAMASTAAADDLRALHSEEEQNDEDDLSSSSSVDDLRPPPGDALTRKRSHERESLLLAAEDSQESTVAKTLSEVVHLVVQALKNVPENAQAVDAAAAGTKPEDGTGAGGANDSASRLPIAMDDSILAEARTSARAIESVGGAMAGSDLASTVAALMHHAPVLRYMHVASALCRAAVPQTSSLIARMGANCPAAVPCLLRGCMIVYRQAHQSQRAIASAARSSVMALAKMSDREMSRVRTMLRQEGSMIDVQLELAARQNALEAACLLVEELSQRVSARNQQPTVISKKSTTSDDGVDEDLTLPRPLEQLLDSHPAVVIHVMNALRHDLAKHRKHATSVAWGRVSIIFTALAWLLCRVPTANLLHKHEDEKKAHDGEKALEQLCHELKEWADVVKGLSKAPAGAPEIDRPLSLLLCVTFAAVASMFQDLAGTVARRDTCKEVMKIVITCSDLSHWSNALLCEFVLAVRRSEVDSMLAGILVGSDSPSVSKCFTDSLSGTVLDASRWLLENCQDDFQAATARGLVPQSLLSRPSVGLSFVRFVQPDDHAAMDRVQELLRTVLVGAEPCLSFLRDHLVPMFVEESAASLLRRDGPQLPLVLPLQLEMMANGLSFDSSRWSSRESTFLLCLLYCFCFKDQIGSDQSPFAFDPRDLPLVEVRSLCERFPDSLVSSSMRLKLKGLIDRHCPEIAERSLLRLERHGSAQSEAVSHRSDAGRLSTSLVLSRCLRQSLEDSSSDPSGLLAERAFVMASTDLNDASLFTTTIDALMAEPHEPVRVFTYSGLCRDPLVLMKCPLSVWERKGLRRVVLLMLGSLLRTNDNVAKQFAPNEETRQEYIEARNELVVRCLVTTMAGSTEGYCSMTVALIRYVTARDRGVTAMMLKQGLSDEALDWFVDWIPESMEDAAALSVILSERSSLTTAERLVAADGILRIAIAHGHRQSKEAKELVFAALSQLIACFFLVIGPVGVPVNALVGDGHGLDATHISRKAAFRMLKALQRVNSYRSQLRSECVMALQKLAGLCKGENIVGGVPGAVANRQKALLKELLEAVTHASSAMGSGL